jgi:transcriptional regulator with XRE-family HTH domain
MPSIPMCQPDGPKIRELLEVRGYSVAEFARMIGRRHERTIWNAIAGKPVGVRYIRQIARGLRVKPSVISDWKNDDDIWDEPEPKALAS